MVLREIRIDGGYMLNILMYVSNILILISIFVYFIMIYFGRKIIVSKSSSFDIIKEITSKNSINVIESKGYFSVYNIKRKIIKLSSKCYYGNSLSSFSLALIESGISIIDNNNKYIDFFKKIFSNLKILYIFPIISIFINSVTYTVNDSKISLILMVLISFVTYIFIDIKRNGFEWLKDNLNKVKDINKKNVVRIINFINGLLLLDKFIIMAEFIMVFRFIIILLEIY